MSFPIYAEKYHCRPVLTAQDIIKYRRQVGRLANVPDLQAVLLCLERGLPRRLRWQIPISDVGKMNGDLYGVKKTKNKVAVMANFGGGSPMVVSLAEEFIAMGARRLVLMTGGGALQPGLKAGDIIVSRQAIRDEGVSYHYLPPEKYVQSDVQLGERLANAIQVRGKECVFGSTWTTDAGFMETEEEVQQYQAEGVKTVEMESAGLFALAQARHVAAVSAVVVMDSLASLRWQAPQNFDAVQRSLETVYKATIDILSE
jgi:uridine phosphorylase